MLLYLYSCHFTQLLPNLHHSQSVELAIFQQRLPGGILFSVGIHLCDFRIDGHGVTSVLHTALEIFIVELRIIGLHSRLHLRDAERPFHLRQIHHLLSERLDKIHDMIADVEQMVAQVGIGGSQIFQTIAFKILVVSRSTYALWNLLTQLLCEGTARIADRVTQELGVL